MNIIGGKITISKAKRHLGSEITAAEENTSDVSPKAAVITVSCQPSVGGDVQTTDTTETLGTSELGVVDSNLKEDTVARKVIEKLMSEMLDQCVDEADFTNELDDDRTADQMNVVPSNPDRCAVPGVVMDVTSGKDNSKGNEIESKELTDLDSECDMFDDNSDLGEVHRDNTDGQIFQHPSDASAEHCATHDSPVYSSRNMNASRCAEQMPNTVMSIATALGLKEHSQIEESYAETEGSGGIAQCITTSGVGVENDKVSVVFNSSIPCEEATAVLNDDINESIVNGDDDTVPNDKSLSSNEECNNMSKCKIVQLPNSENTMIYEDQVLPSEVRTFSDGECARSTKDMENMDREDDDVNLLVEFDAELGIISIDSLAISKNENKMPQANLCDSNEITKTQEEVTGESVKASIDASQTISHCHLYFQ